MPRIRVRYSRGDEDQWGTSRRDEPSRAWQDTCDLILGFEVSFGVVSEEGGGTPAALCAELQE